MTTKKQPTNPDKQKKPSVNSPARTIRIFDRKNFYVMIAGALVVFVGYLLMRGGHQEGKVFNPEEIYSTTRITIAPILILLGFCITIFGILYPFNTYSKDSATSSDV